MAGRTKVFYNFLFYNGCCVTMNRLINLLQRSITFSTKGKCILCVGKIEGEHQYT